MNNEIKFLHNSEIDILRWDQVVGDAFNSRVYAFSWYLNILRPNWHGLIYGDYDYVMPVIFSKKWGISYMYQPVYAQQHGIFPPSGPEITERFISFLQKKFRYFNVSLNTFNDFQNKGVEIEERKNYILPLDKPYNDIWYQYSAHAKRYVRKAILSSNVLPGIKADDFFSLKQKYGKVASEEKHIYKLKQIIDHSLHENRGVIYGAFSANNELIGAAFFLKDNTRFTYLSSVLSDEGKQNRSMYAVVDKFVSDHAEQSCVLDFEGSNIEGIARFFEGFGASVETYPHLAYNNLPLLVKVFKK